MKRDMDLIRKLLFELESRTWNDTRQEPEIEGYDSETIAYHLFRMIEAGLINGLDASSSSGLHCIPTSLTWLGHDFLDAAREDSRWNKAMKLVKEKAGAAALETIKALLIKMTQESLGLH